MTRTTARIQRYSLAAFLSVGMLACSKAQEVPPPVEGESTNASVDVETLVVTQSAFKDVTEVSATVSASTGAAAVIASPVAARISMIKAVPGQRVAKGDLLAEIDRTAVDGELERSRAVFASNTSAMQRVERLVQEGILPRRELEAARAELAQAQAQLSSAQRVAEMSTLRSPISGVVTRVVGTIGMIADPAVPLIEVTDMSRLELVMQVPQDVAARLPIGATVSLRGETGVEDSIGNATVRLIAPVVDSVARTVAIRAAPGRLSRALRIGETLTASIVMGMTPKALMIPAIALIPSGESFDVFVVDSADTAHRRAVTIGGRSGEFVQVLSGLQAGERIVTKGAFGVDDGNVVRVAGHTTP